MLTEKSKGLLARIRSGETTVSDEAIVRPLLEAAEDLTYDKGGTHAFWPSIARIRQVITGRDMDNTEVRHVVIEPGGQD